MGNNTSTTTRKSTAGQRNGVRKSSSSGRDSSVNDRSLYEEFNESILHPVKREDQPPNKSPLVPIQPTSSKSSKEYTIPYNQFTNDLIEDEFNELNDGLIETDVTEVSRNILPNSEFHSSSEATGFDEDAMDIDDEEPASLTPTPDLSKVDFTKITNQSPSDFNTRAANNMSDIRLSSYQQQQPIHKKSKNNNYTYHNQNSHNEKLIPVEIKWVNTNREPINRISIIGSFSNWRDVIKLKQSSTHENEYITTITLPLGVHKLLYIINNEYRVSDQLPTATDQEGIFFNWFEVIDEAHLFNHSLNQLNHLDASTAFDANIISPDYHNQQKSKQQAGRYEVDLINKKSNSFLAKISKETSNFEHVEFLENSNSELADLKDEQKQSENYPYQSESNSHSNKYVPYNEPLSSSASSFQKGGPQGPPTKIEYSNEIPQMFVNYDYFKSKSSNYELPEPPQLPAHLNNVLLNKISQQGGSQGQLTNIPQVPSSYHHPNSGDPLRNANFNETSSSVSSYGSSSTSTSHYKRPPLRRADSSYYASNKEAYHLSIPNHVILNHLMTTSIRNDVLTVACITRYSGKFVTQIMHSPADK